MGHPHAPRATHTAPAWDGLLLIFTQNNNVRGRSFMHTLTVCWNAFEMHFMMAFPANRNAAVYHPLSVQIDLSSFGVPPPSTPRQCSRPCTAQKCLGVGSQQVGSTGVEQAHALT